MTLDSVYSDNAPLKDLMQPRSNRYFDLEPINTVAGGDPYNTWNLKFFSKARAEEGYFNPNLSSPSPLQGNLTFNFTLEVPGETPSIRQVSVTNNFITNNEPTWQYLKGPSWGVTPIVPNPSDPADLLKAGYPGEWCDDTILLTNKRPELSPFLPLKSSALTTTTNPNANQWTWGRDSQWSMSVDDQKNASAGFGGATILGKMFKKVNGNWRPYIETYNNNVYPPALVPQDSAVRFNVYRLNNFGSGLGTKEAPAGKIYFGNGGFGYVTPGSEPYIKRCELAIYNDDSFNVGPPYTPVRDFKDFELVGTPGVDGPQYRSSDRTWGYSKFPFDVKVPGAREESYMGGLNVPTDAWYFLVDPFNPPFCQFDSTKNNDKFKPIGSLNGSDFCVYRITIALREKFTGGLQNSNEMIVYVKIFQ